MKTSTGTKSCGGGYDPSDITVFKADKRLQAKIGTGTVDPRLVERCQEVMDSHNVDFTPLAEEYLEDLRRAIQTARSGGDDLKTLIATMTAPVMQLKANASVFGYTLIGRLANIMLGFLERIQTLDDDALSIVEAHYKTLNAIVSKKMTGTGGIYGDQMQEELESVCARYFAKRK